MAPIDPSDIYLLGRDATETERLNRQHEVIVDNFGYVIHPRIGKTLPPNARIADVAAGSGIWTLHAARTLPDTTELIGYDLSGAQFPSTENLPPNVSFSTADAKQPFDAALNGTFDLVHVRALVTAMRPTDWALVISNLVPLLKPGTGALQWTEADMSTMCIVRGAGEAHVHAPLRDLYEKFHAATGELLNQGRPRLTEAFHEAKDLADVEIDVVSSDRLPETRNGLSQLCAKVYLDWAEKAAGVMGEELTKLQDGVKQDISNGAYVRCDTYTIIARRT